MKKILYILMLTAAGTLSACTTDDGWDEWQQPYNASEQENGISGSVDAAVSGELTTFDVVVNKESLSEDETLPSESDAYYEDYVETFETTATIQIAFDGQTATVTGKADGVSVAVKGAHVTVKSSAKGMAYVLSGSSTDGSFKINTEKKFKLTLAGINLTNPQGAAVNNQGKRCYLVVANGTENSLTDGSVYTDIDGEDQKGTFFSEGKLAISGSGMLSVYAKGKNGIVSDDYVFIRPNTNIYVNSTAKNGIKSNDGIIIRGGVINVEVCAEAAKGIKSDGIIDISGGRVTAIATGDATYDSDDKEYKGAAALNTDSVMVISGGEVYAKATGKGGKGIKVDQTLTMSGGKVFAVCTGSNYGSGNNSVSAKAIKADGDMTISGGQIMARANSHEAIETKGKLTVKGGSIGACSSDDAINSAQDMTITNGYVYGLSTGNDGIDANGNLTINGGVVIGLGASMPEEGIDAAEGRTLAINGGVVVGLGGGGESLSGSQQKAAISGVSVNSGSSLVVSNASGEALFALLVPRSFSNSTLQVSHPSFTSGSTYTLSTSTSADSSENFYGFLNSPSVNNANSISTFTTSTTTSGGMGGGGFFPGGMGGGGRPGGW